MTGTRPATIGVANANFVTDFLAVGGDLDMFDDRLAIRQASDLLVIGRITHILDVRQEGRRGDTGSTQVIPGAGGHALG